HGPEPVVVRALHQRRRVPGGHMSKDLTTRIRVPRESLSTRIGALELGKAKAYADFIREGDPDGPVPCWGAITKRFVEAFATDAERLAVLDQLIAEGDRRPLFLFLDTSRKRPKLLEALCARVGELPVSVQRALVAMPEAATYVAASLERLDPSARLVWDGGEDSKRAERELLAGRVGELMAFQYFVPDTIDPRQEPPSKRVAAPTDGDAPGEGGQPR